MTDKEVMQSAMNEHCPACGYYCLGNGGVYCIDKPTTVETTRACLAQPEQYDQTELELCKKCGWKAVWPDGCLVCEKQETQPEPAPVAIDGNTSDGYHTFNELYEFRKAYNAALFNEWAANQRNFVHKSWKHHDGELCFGGGWFIVVARLIGGQISNHYKAEDWDLFQIPETDKALFEFDGHTGADVIERLKNYTTPPQRVWVGLTDAEAMEIEDKSPDIRWAIIQAEAKLKEKNT